jgi:hypothetical protein
MGNFFCFSPVLCRTSQDLPHKCLKIFKNLLYFAGWVVNIFHQEELILGLILKGELPELEH